MYIYIYIYRERERDRERERERERLKERERNLLVRFSFMPYIDLAINIKSLKTDLSYFKEIYK